LGEHVLCKHEVVGSIPIASTRAASPKIQTLWRRHQRLAMRMHRRFLDIVKRMETEVCQVEGMQLQGCLSLLGRILLGGACDLAVADSWVRRVG
jgi:hypothetical protein